LNSSKMVVALLLLGAVAVGFGEGLNVEKASAVITSYSTTTAYSTWTSTSYYYYERTSTSTLLTRSFVTLVRQQVMDGPYLKIRGTFNYRYYADGGQVADIQVSAELTNLMSVPIEKGKIVLLVKNLEGTVTEEALSVFWEIRVGETITIRQGIPISKTFYHEKTMISFVMSEINCKGTSMEVPFATYTSSQRFTETHLKTYASAYTKVSTFSIEEPSPFMSPQTILALVAVAAVAVVAVVILKMRKPSTQPPPQSQPSKQVCSSCGAVIEVGSEFCHNCGKKIE